MSVAERDAGKAGRACEPGMVYRDWQASQAETRPPIGLAALPVLLTDERAGCGDSGSGPASRNGFR